MFDATLLPNARDFYAGELEKLGRPSRGWAKALCCFHDERTPSLSVNLGNGGFHCFGCGASGGDLVDFIRLRYGCTFKAACQRLRCWRGDTSAHAAKEIEKSRKETARIRDAAARLVAEEKRLRLEARESLHHLEKLQRVVSARLSELEKGAFVPDRVNPPSEEMDVCWSALSLLENEIREQECIYQLLAFASAGVRARYVLNEAARPEMLAEFAISEVMP
jgi:hypothetical protein